jgi:hypothetical protein
MGYDTTILADSPTVFWPLDDIVSSNPATIVDDSGNSHMGTLTVNIGCNARQPSLLSADPAAYSIALLDAEITSPGTVPGPGTGDFALEIWLKTTDTTDQMVVVTFTGTDSASIQLVGGVPYAFCGSGGYVTGASGIADGNPHHVVCLRRSGTLYLYVDGATTGTPVTNTTDLGKTGTFYCGSTTGGGYYFRSGNLQKVAYYDVTLTGPKVAYHYAAGAGSSISATITEQGLPANHNGNITVHAVGIGTSWTPSTIWTPSGVVGWSVHSKTFVDSTHYTIVLSGPTALPATAGATGTLTLTESVTGSTAPTTTVGTPTLSISPTAGGTGTTPTLTLTGSNTLWASETASGLFSESGGAGASIGKPTVGSNTSATGVLTTGSATGTFTIEDTSTGATATFTLSNSAVAALSSAELAPCGIFANGYAIDRPAVFAKSLYAGWDFTFTGSSLSMGLANLEGGVALNVTVDGVTTSPTMPPQSATSWPAATVIWTGAQGTHTVQVREAYTGNPQYLALDPANAFIVGGMTPSFGPPADTGPTYVINQAPFVRHAAREGAWQYALSDLITGVDAPTLYAAANADQAGQVLRWRGHATKIRIRGLRSGSAVLSFLQDGVAGAPFMVSTDVNDPYGWFDLGTPTDASGDHEYGLIVNSGTVFLHEVQMCGGALNTSATFLKRGNLVGIGDSKMCGTGIGAQYSVPGIYDFGRGYLFKAAQATNRTPLNLAKSGSTLLCDPLGSAVPYQAEVIASYLAYLDSGWDATQDVIVWELGYNDASRVIDGTTPSITAWTDAIAPKLAALAATGAMVLIYAIPASSTGSIVNTSVSTDIYAAMLNSATQAAVDALGASNVTFKTDTRSGPNAINGASNPGYVTPGAGDTQDGVHFNSHGESQMVAILTADVPTWTAPATACVIKRRPRTIGAS